MAKKEIKQKIVLDGEKEYREALRQASRNIKTLNSELKAETAELGKNATAQQKNEVRVKSLQKQIREQEKALKAAREGLAAAQKNYADNEDVIQRWEQKVNEARAALANMKNELDGTGDAFRDINVNAAQSTVAAQSFAQAFSGLADIGTAVSGAIEEIFRGVLDTVGGAIREIWGEIVDLAARSNNIVDLAGFWGTDVNTIQKYKGAVAEISGSLSDLNDVVTKINAVDAQKVTEATGISKVNYKDQWKYAMAVMDAMSQMETGQRNAAAFEIFGGRQATKAFDLLNDWKKMQGFLDTYDPTKGGYGLTEEETQQMSDLYDMVNGIHERWSQLKDMGMVKLFGQLSMDLSSNARGILDALLSYMNAETQEERDAAIDEMVENIEAMFTRIGEAIQAGMEALDRIAEELKESKNPLVQTIGNILGSIVDALQWFTEDNAKNLVSALNIIAGFWVSMTAITMLNRIGELIGHLRTLKTFGIFKWLFGGAGAAAGGGGGAPVVAPTGGLGGGGGAAVGAASSIGSLIGSFATMGMMGYGMYRAFEAVGNYRRENAEQVRGTEEYLGAKSAGVEELLAAYIAAEREVSEAGPETTSEEADALYQAVAETRQALEDAVGGLEALDAYSAWRQENSYGSNYWELPANWWSGQGGEQLKSSDIQGFRGLPAQLQAAARAGVASGVSGLRVTMDGAAVGQIVAPYVSQSIARDILP